MDMGRLDYQSMGRGHGQNQSVGGPVDPWSCANRAVYTQRSIGMSLPSDRIKGRERSLGRKNTRSFVLPHLRSFSVVFLTSYADCKTGLTTSWPGCCDLLMSLYPATGSVRGHDQEDNSQQRGAALHYVHVHACIITKQKVNYTTCMRLSRLTFHPLNLTA